MNTNLDPIKFVNEYFETKLAEWRSKWDLLEKEMEQKWITSNHFQRGDLILNPISELFPRPVTTPLNATPKVRWSVKLQTENGEVILEGESYKSLDLLNQVLKRNEDKEDASEKQEAVQSNGGSNAQSRLCEEGGSSSGDGEGVCGKNKKRKKPSTKEERS